MNTRADRRTPDIVSDAVLEILKRDPAEFTGEAVYDEAILREAGIDDFAPYNLTPGDPAPLSARTFDPEYSRP
jgi:citronellol/citronellal dehydrogenase